MGARQSETTALVIPQPSLPPLEAAVLTTTTMEVEESFFLKATASLFTPGTDPTPRQQWRVFSCLELSDPRDSVKPAEIMPIGMAITAIPHIAVNAATSLPSIVMG